MGDHARHPGNCKCNPCTKGWHSRRHETRDAHDEARERYQREHGRPARQRKAELRERA